MIGPGAHRVLRLLEDRVRNFAAEHDLWQPAQKVILAVSGGADSLCMLRIMAKIAARDRLSLVVAHLHHGIRPAEGDADEAFVAAMAGELGLPLISERADVPALVRMRRIGVEEAGRIARREFLDRVLKATGSDAAATAHTRTDHVETVLLHLLRGAGLRGLTGIPPRGFGSRIRPLLCLTREETQQFCTAAGLEPRCDPANDDLSFQRNRIRRRVLPLLRAEINPAADDAIDRVSQVAADALEFLDEAGRRLLEEARGPSPFLYRRGPLRAAPRGVAAEAIRLIVEATRPSDQALGFDETRALLSLVRTGGELTLGPDHLVQVSGPYLRVRRGKPVGATPADPPRAGRRAPQGSWNSPFEKPLPVPGEILLPDGAVIFARPAPQELTAAGDAGKDERQFVIVRPTGALVVRHPRPGDRLSPVGRGGSRKLKQLFSEKRVPVWERPTWPVIIDETGILWVPDLAVAARVPIRDAAAPGDFVRLGWRRRPSETGRSE